MKGAKATTNEWYVSPSSLAKLLKDLDKVGFKTSVIVTESDMYLTITKKPDKER